MRIGLLESLPILREKIKSERISYPFGGKIVAESVRRSALYDLILSDRNYFPRTLSCRAAVFLVPATAEIPVLPEQGIFLTGGMAHSDSVSFSSIGDEDAMLCVQQEIFLRGKNIVQAT